jgi:hypothetical protein
MLSASASALTLARLVDGKIASTEILGVKTLDRGLGAFLIHFDKTEPSRAAGFAVSDERHFVNGSKSFERGTDGIRGRIERKITDIQSLTHEGIPSFAPSVSGRNRLQKQPAAATLYLW